MFNACIFLEDVRDRGANWKVAVVKPVYIKKAFMTKALTVRLPRSMPISLNACIFVRGVRDRGANSKVVVPNACIFLEDVRDRSASRKVAVFNDCTYS